MPEIKHTFTAGKMNKDLDLRLVRNGEYRDASNIQVRTTDADAVGDGSAGTAQNVKGNKSIGLAYGITGYDNNKTKIIGSVADEKNNKAYFFAASPVPDDGKNTISFSNPDAGDIYAARDVNSAGASIRFWVDSIIEIDADAESSQPVFVDVFAVTGYKTDIFTTQPGTGSSEISTTSYNSFSVVDGIKDQLRVGMRFFAVKIVGNVGQGSEINQTFIPENSVTGLPEDVQDGVEIIAINGNTVYLAQEVDFNISAMNSAVYFIHPERVLNFNYKKIISNSINIIDNMLFWSDGETEPKKINIERSLAGTLLTDYQTASSYETDPKHTKLMVKKSNGDLTSILNVEDLGTTYNTAQNYGHVEKEHITVIRKKPTNPPNLEMKETTRLGATTVNINYPQVTDLDNDGEGEILGGFVSYYVMPEDLDGDGIVNVDPAFDSSSITDPVGNDPSSAEQAYLIQQGDEIATGGSERYVRLPSVIDVRENDILRFTSTSYDLTPVLIDAQVVEGPIFYDEIDDTNGYIILCVFVDSRLSTLNPTNWDVEVLLKKPLFETKFGRFGYRYKYEDGEYSAFSPWSELAFLPGEFLYSPKNGFNAGMQNNVRELIVRGFIPALSVRPNDVRAVDILFKTTDDQNIYVVKSITRERDSEWEDYVEAFDGTGNEFEGGEDFGKLTITSEMINRVLESNQLLRSWDNVPIKAKAQEVTGSRLVYGNYTQGYEITTPIGLKQTVISNPIGFPNPEKSVKSIRTYKWGMVFGDKYGRETPVLPSSFKTAAGEVTTGDATVEKTLCHFKNQFQLQQDWDATPESWMDYVKYYVKEVSSEYYNLVMDRFFDSGDDGLWLSFNSADRNKVDEETYLILKNEHGSQQPVLEPARYKILAIENEAPNFIKLKQNPVGSVIISRNHIYSGTSGVTTNAYPDKLVGVNKIETTNEFGINLNMFRGTPRVKIRGTFENDATDPVTPFIAESPFRTASNFRGSDGSPYSITIDKVFNSNEVNMYTKINNQLNELGISGDLDQELADNTGNADYINYTMEFFDEVEHEGPEFAGKFFVKIQRDETLDAKVTSRGSGDYNVLDSFDIAYITNDNQNPATNGDQSSYLWAAYNSTVAGSVAGFTTANDVDDLVDGPTIPVNMNSETNDQYLPDFKLRLSFEDSYNIEYSDEVAITAAWTQGVPEFGPGNYKKTKEFWQNWYNKTTTQIFLDEAPAAKDYTYRFPGPAILGFNMATNRLLHHFGHGSPISHSVWRNSGDQGATVSGYQIFGNFEGSLQSQYAAPNVNASYNDGTGLPQYIEELLTSPEHPSLYDVWDDEGKLGGFGYTGYSENYKPHGIAGGFASAGQYGQMSFSCVANVSDVSENSATSSQRGDVGGISNYTDITVGSATYPSQFTDGENNNFKNRMQNPGTLFRFTADPSQTVYRILQNTQYVNNIFTDSSNAPQFVGDLEIHQISNFYDSSKTPEVNKAETAALRSTFIVRFARVGELNETLPGTGIDITYFDPRGQVRHDGTQTFGIEIVERAMNADADLFFETTAACWETEPKETADIDIYYEASPAIPMILKSDNLQSFVGSSKNAALASSFYVKPRVSQGSYEYVEVNDSAFAFASFNDNVVQIKRDQVVELINPGAQDQEYVESSSDLVPQSTATIPGLLFESTNQNLISIGDKVCFRRPDGCQTESLVVDHVKRIGSEVLNRDSFKQSNRISLKPSVNMTTSIAVQEDQNQTLLRFTTFSTNLNTSASATDENGDAVNVVDDNYESVSFTTGLSPGLLGTYTVPTDAVGQAVGKILKIGMFVTSSTSGLVPKHTYIKKIQYKDFNEVGGGGPSGTLDILEVRLNKALNTNIQGSAANPTFTFIEQTGYFKLDRNIWRYPVMLNWFNCYSFGNGIESDRIRDDFNTPTIDNGCRVSSTFLEYGQENISSGLIHSGLYNSISSVNNLNEFNMAEKITKNINPSYGSIQALKSRDNNIVVFSEDKVLKVLANKDAVFNADGNPQLVATNRVLGDATPYVGDYGISTNPESLASDSYRLYFTDKQRGAVLRLSMDGLTPISDVGMRTYFRENLKKCDSLVGTFDGVNGEYNLSLDFDDDLSLTNKSVSFNEGSKGWVSFKSFVPTTGLTVSGKYLTTTSEKVGSYNVEDKMNEVYEHHRDDMSRNHFYGKAGSSSIEIVFNDLPSVVKSFKAVNYEGTRGKIIDMQSEAESAGVTYSDEYYNLDGQTGWYVDTFTTDMQVGKVDEFINKENKWFNRIISSKSNLSTGDLTNDIGQIAVQGLGNPISSDSTGAILSSSEVNIVLGELPPLEIIFIINYSSSVSVSLDTGVTTAPKKYKWIAPNGLVARNYISSELNGTEVDFAIDGTNTTVISSTPYLAENYFTQYNYNGDENQNYIEYGEGLWTITIEEFTNFNAADDPIDFSSRSITGQVFLTEGSGASSNFDSLTLYDG
jgi:hypothetical protein